MSGLHRQKPLWKLCQEGNLEGVKEAVRQGRDINETERRTDLTGLMYAVFRRSGSLVMFLLKQKGIDVNRQSRDGATALHIACQCDNVDALQELVTHPNMTSLNTKHNTGDTPIMVALKTGHANCFRDLFNLPGVDLETKDSDGKSLEEVARWVIVDWEFLFTLL